jgi:hypothetical protein
LPANARTVLLGLSATDAALAVGALATYPVGGPASVALTYRTGTNVETTVAMSLADDGTTRLLNYSGTPINVLGDVYGYLR